LPVPKDIPHRYLAPSGRSPVLAIPIMKTAIAIFFLAVPFVFAAYLFLNMLIAAWIIRNARNGMNEFLGSFSKFWFRQYEAISSSAAFTTLALNIVFLLLFAWTIRTPTQTAFLPAILIGLTFLISASISSLIARMPFFLMLWKNTFTKILLLASPVYLHFVAKTIASERLTSLFEISASHMPITHVVCTFLFLLLLSGLLFGLAAVLFETMLLIALAVGSFKKPPSGNAAPNKPGGWLALALSSKPSRRSADRLHLERVSRQVSVALVLLSSFFACFFLMEASVRIYSGNVERLVLHSMVFEFDAIPAKYCRLSPEDEAASRLENPLVKVLPVSSSQEKAFVLTRGATLLDPVTVVDLPSVLPAEKSLRVGSMVNCLVVQENVGERPPAGAR
jgi:hypothetical protein